MLVSFWTDSIPSSSSDSLGSWIGEVENNSGQRHDFSAPCALCSELGLHHRSLLFRRHKSCKASVMRRSELFRRFAPALADTASTRCGFVTEITCGSARIGSVSVAPCGILEHLLIVAGFYSRSSSAVRLGLRCYFHTYSAIFTL